MPDESPGPAEARAIAYRYLAGREHSCRELVQKLTRRGIAADTAAEVVQQLADVDVVSDDRFSEMFVRAKIGRLFGPLKIRALLRQRGIADQLIEQVLAGYQDPFWVDTALTWVRKKVSGPLDRDGKARLYRSGKNRGFTHDQIMRALDRAVARIPDEF